MQNALFSKISVEFGKRKFSTQNEVKDSFQQRFVFLEKIAFKTHILARYSYNLAQSSFFTEQQPFVINGRMYVCLVDQLNDTIIGGPQEVF